MKIIYLPGSSIKNKEEGQMITSSLYNSGCNVYFHQWNHWKNESEPIGWDAEAEKVKSHIDSNDELILIGKSIGTYVVVKLISEYKDKIKKIILLGIPVNGFNKEEQNEYYQNLKSISAPITVIQNSKDPYGSIDLLKSFLKDISYTLIEKDRSDHVYKYPDDILELING